MPHFPLFVSLDRQPVLVVGGGTVALRKIEKLLPFSPRLRVIAPEICPAIRSLDRIELTERAFIPGDQSGQCLVIAATDCREVNREISALCRAEHIPVNVVDDPELCTFLFPALVQAGGLTVGISTGGSSPTAAICLKEQIAQLVPERMDLILDQLHLLREQLRSEVSDDARRQQCLRKLCQAAMALGRPLTDGEIHAVCREVHP